MIEEFNNKLNNKEYISNHLYEQVKEQYKDFDIDSYNNEVLDKLYKENKEYFDNMYNGIDASIHLDEEQCKAILADEKYSLIIAGAGTGKTTTMVSKVKYLVDKKNVDPSRILIMSYTRKATEEIAYRIEDQFELPVNVMTFHSLGYRYIKQIYPGHKCEIMSRNKKEEIQTKFFAKIFKDKTKISEIYENFENIKETEKFIFGRYFKANYSKFETYEEFVESYIKYKVEQAKLKGINEKIREWIKREGLKDYGIRTIQGDVVKSFGEMIIANHLFINNIEYSYEEVYENLMENNSIYKPDFTIEYAGEKIYIEYYGMDDKKYNRIRKKKEEYHKKYGNKYISIERQEHRQMIRELDRKLSELGIPLNKRCSEKIYESILRQNPLAQVFKFSEYLDECLMSKKESNLREIVGIPEKHLLECNEFEKEWKEIQYKYIKEYSDFYEKECFGTETYYFDYADLLYYSVKYLEQLTTTENLEFDYIILDEYQDISEMKYELTYKTAKRNDAKVSAVGDDWQSIYGFSGSRIEYTYNFEKYFSSGKCFKITRTYRNSKELIDTTGKFIMKNESQIKKELVSSKHIDKPIVFKEYKNNNPYLDEIDCLKETILEIHKENPNHRILILGRKNRMIDNLRYDSAFEDGIGSRINFVNHNDIYIDGMTMHKAKGLAYDQVIIMGLYKNFPSESFVKNWYVNLYTNKKVEELIRYAEERRLFYVAMTRTKNKVYLLYNEEPKLRSSFVDEIKNIVNKNNDKDSLY